MTQTVFKSFTFNVGIEASITVDDVESEAQARRLIALLAKIKFDTPTGNARIGFQRDTIPEMDVGECTDETDWDE